jgi:p-cumate 2,3-dioxygenase beta subunit
MNQSFSSLAAVTRADVEDLLYHEAALLDGWQLDEWLQLLTEDVTYRVPSNDRPDADHRQTLFTIADDAKRLRSRVVRLKDSRAHAEFPHSRTRRMISNVRIVSRDDNGMSIASNFIIYRFRQNEFIRTFVGHYRHTLRLQDSTLRITAREAVLDAHELGSMGVVSFIL